jgi:hypothetical protein
MERVKCIARPVGRACMIVAAQMRSAMEGRHTAKRPVIALVRVRDWKMRRREPPKRMVD